MCRRRKAGALELTGVRWHYYASATAARARLAARCELPVLSMGGRSLSLNGPACQCRRPCPSQNAAHLDLKPIVALRAENRPQTALSKSEQHADHTSSAGGGLPNDLSDCAPHCGLAGYSTVAVVCQRLEPIAFSPPGARTDERRDSHGSRGRSPDQGGGQDRLHDRPEGRDSCIQRSWAAAVSARGCRHVDPGADSRPT